MQGTNAWAFASLINSLGKVIPLCMTQRESGQAVMYEQLSLMNYPPQTFGALASRARISALRENKKACRTAREADCFMKLCDCLPAAGKKINPDGYSLKMLRIYLALETDLISRGCSLNWGGLGYSCEWQVLNSKDFGVPQNRERVFIVASLGAGSGRKVFPIAAADGENPCKLQEITQGAAIGLYAIDLSYKAARITQTARCLQARYNKGPCNRESETTGVLIAGNAIKKEIDEACTLDACYYKFFGCNQARTGVMVAPVATPDYENKHQNGRRLKEPGEEMFTLTAQASHGVAISGIYTNDSPAFHRGALEGLSRTLKASKSDAGITDGVRIRKLTPRECWRLQGFPDEYFDKAKAAGVSDSQLYKQAGNAVTVSVAEAIGRRLKEVEYKCITD